MVDLKLHIPGTIPRSDQTIRDNVLRIAVSYAGWLALFFITGVISKILIPQVRTLKAKEQMFWKLAMVRAICGMFTFWAVHLVFIDKRLSQDFVSATTDESWTFISIIIGFFIFEELTLIYFDVKYNTFSKELHMHHLFAFNGFFLAAYFDHGHYFAAKGFILEVSTPFSCICWCLLKLKLERTKAWKINQWILINIFHLRSVLEFWWWYDIYQDWANVKENLPWLYTVNMFMGLGIVSFWLTPYWTYKKTVQFFYPSDWNVEGGKGKKKDEIDKSS